MAEESKYWIKAGIKVEIRNTPGLVVTVDFIKTIDKTVEGETKVFTIGVQCHWIDKNWTYQKGIFHINELIKPVEFQNIKNIPHAKAV